MRPKPKKRTRRTAEEAQSAILDATERRLRDVGPAGVRLQDIARDVGVSHPAILHHFGSREALVEAVVLRAIEQLQTELLEAVTAHDVDEAHTAEMLERVFQVLGDRGYGRIMAWVIMSGHQPLAERAIQTVAHAVHARRCQEHPEKEPSYEDTLFTVLAAAFTMFGDAVAGRELHQSAGMNYTTSGKRFRQWFAALLLQHLDGPSPID
jgi:AcrR family transcriptional regulator